MPSPKKARKPYPTTTRPYAECSPIARWIGSIMIDQQRAIRLLGGMPMPRVLIQESMVPVADRLIMHILPGGMLGDAMMLGIPLGTGTVAQMGIKRLLAEGAVIMQGADGNPCIKLHDGTIVTPSPDPDAETPIPPIVVEASTN